MKRQEHLKSIIKDMLNTKSNGFTDWEMEFLDNMFNWKIDFTEHQAKKIESIYRERM